MKKRETSRMGEGQRLIAIKADADEGEIPTY